MCGDFYTYAQSAPPFTPCYSHYSPSVNFTENSKYATKNTDSRVDGNHYNINTLADILAHPSVRLTRGGVILIGPVRAVRGQSVRVCVGLGNDERQ